MPLPEVALEKKDRKPKAGKDRRRWTKVGFGKYAGKTLPQVVLIDPDWFFWAVENKVFDTPDLQAEAAEVYRKAMRIRIHQPDSVVEYVVPGHIGKLTDVVVVPVAELREDFVEGVHEGWFDLYLPRLISPYDKTGNKIMLRAIRHYVFGNEKARLTKARCEAFFDDDSNFTTSNP